MEKLKTDVVVMGSGVGGLAAAITTAEGGATVIVFEKRPFIGGISIFPREIFAVESKIQQQNGISLTRNEMFRTFMENTHWKADARLVKAFIDKSASTIEWLQQLLRIEFEVETRGLFTGRQLTGHSPKVPGAFASVIKMMRNKAESMGVEIRLSTPVRKLIKDGDSIVGVVAEDQSGETIQVNAKAVIIASGGYPHNKEMLKKYCGFELGRDLFLLPQIELTGDGIQMAWDVGADSDGLGLELLYDLPSRSGHPAFGAGLRIAHQPYLWVNQNGVRFFDEGIAVEPAYTANALARQKNKCAYLIFDENTKKYMDKEDKERMKDLGFGKIADNDDPIKKFLDKGDENIFVANSLAELGDKIGVNQDILQKTIDEYNKFCEKGYDDLFGKDPKYLQPVKQPKFYALRLMPTTYGTKGGIKINERVEVLNTQNNVIPGLYAVGDCANGIITYNYWLAHALAGNPASFALNTGRIAGENAVKYASER